MKTIDKLGKKIGALGFGGAAISGEGKGYGFGDIDESKSIEMLLKAYDEGVNVFDFAPIYGHNLAEARAGMAFRNHRENVYLVSKAGVDWHDNGRVNMSNDPKIVMKMLEQSLRNFQSDYIDIYMIHWPDPRVDIRRPLEVLYNAQEKGKITHIGLCNTNVEDLQKAKEVCPVDVIQMEANLFNQNTIKNLEIHVQEHMLTLGWGSFDKGILTQTVDEERKFDSSDCRSWAPWWKKGDWKKKVQFVEKVSRELGLEKGELAHAAINCSQELVDVSLCGMKTFEHLVRNKDFLGRPYSRLEEIRFEFSTY